MRALALLCLLLVAGCDSTTDTPGAPREPGETYRVDVPEGLRPGATLVLFCHGSGQPIAALDEPPLRALRDAWMAEGYVVAASEAGGKAWGNDASLAAYADLAHYCRERYQTGRLVVAANSMGGVAGLLLIARGMVGEVSAFVGVQPVVRPEAISWPEVTAAYGGPVPPQNRPLSYSYSLPMRVYASYEDTLVPRATHADALAAATGCVVVDATGEHGDPSHFNPDDLIPWLAHTLR